MIITNEPRIFEALDVWEDTNCDEEKLKENLLALLQVDDDSNEDRSRYITT